MKLTPLIFLLTFASAITASQFMEISELVTKYGRWQKKHLALNEALRSESRWRIGGSLGLSKTIAHRML